MPYRSYATLQGDYEACVARWHAARTSEDRAWEDMQAAAQRLDERFPAHGPAQRPIIPDALTRQVYEGILNGSVLRQIFDGLEGP